VTFLKKLGQLLLKGATLAAGIYPMVAPLLGSKAQSTLSTAVNDLTLIANQAVTIETALEGKTGADKFAALLPLVAQIIRTSELVSGKEIADETKFQLGVSELAQGVVDILNSIHEKEAKTA
jgi:hypothetical protein